MTMNALADAVARRISTLREGRSVALRTLLMATVASVVAATIPASARSPMPLVPTALVEDVKSAGAGIEFMDYVGSGQFIKLEPGDVLVLSYLKSCEHETIVGGVVIVGTERSNVQGGQVARSKVACDGGKIRLSARETSNSAATAFRLQSADTEPTLFARAPVIQLPRILSPDDRTLLITRTDRRSVRYNLEIDDAAAAAGFYDLAKAKVRLVRGATYEASIGRRKMTFHVDAKAKSGPAPVVSRLLRFQ